MTKGGIGSKNLNYEVTLKEAQRRFTERDFARIAVLAGARVTSDNNLELPFLGQSYTVSPQGEVTLSSKATGPQDQPGSNLEHRTSNLVDEVPLTVKILILHYLATAEGVPVQQKPISFKELPGGAIYIGPFTNRAIRPLVSVFGDNPAELLEVGRELGGTKTDLGDVSVRIDAFPHVPVTLVLWQGDEEFPPSGNILFDVSASHYLPTEDYAVLASLVVYELKNLKQHS